MANTESDRGTVHDGVAIAYLEASGERVDTKFELWRELIYDIRGLRLDSYGIAERLRSWRQA
jgi:hypothetical protein